MRPLLFLKIFMGLLAACLLVSGCRTVSSNVRRRHKISYAQAEQLPVLEQQPKNFPPPARLDSCFPERIITAGWQNCHLQKPKGGTCFHTQKVYQRSDRKKYAAADSLRLQKHPAPARQYPRYYFPVMLGFIILMVFISVMIGLWIELTSFLVANLLLQLIPFFLVVIPGLRHLSALSGEERKNYRTELLHRIILQAIILGILSLLAFAGIFGVLFYAAIERAEGELLGGVILLLLSMGFLSMGIATIFSLIYFKIIYPRKGN
jgi:hypothetical protein